MNAELAMIHRAIRALPHHLNQGYIDEIYREPPEAGQEMGVLAGNCANCGQAVFFTGLRSRDCKPIMIGHASSCSSRHEETSC